MPSRSENSIPPFPEHVPRADISTVDFSLLAAGDEASAQAVYNSARGYGFFCVKNYDVDSDFMFDLANTVFKLSDEEMMKYYMGSTGGLLCCKRSASQYVDEKGTPDHSEFYNVSKDDILHVGGRESLRHPEPVNQRRTELENFMHSFHHVITVIARVLGEQLGLGPDALPAVHRIDRTGGDQPRVTHAPPVGSDVIH
jgi:isopenicillin N synthase-like dioxygenase